MKYLFLLLITVQCYSCVQKKSEKSDLVTDKKNSVVARSDTFDVDDLQYKPSLQADILLDTVNLPESHRVWGTIVLPKISRLDHPVVYRYIDSLAKSKRKNYRETIQQEIVEPSDTSPIGFSSDVWINPMVIYKTAKLISLAFEDGIGHSGTPSFYEFKTFNFDIEKKKQIQFSDYFKMETGADTLFWGNIISRCFSQDIGDLKTFLEWHGPISFAFDKDNVYFFFDRGELFAGGQIGAIKKKYIMEYIRQDYK